VQRHLISTKEFVELLTNNLIIHLVWDQFPNLKVGYPQRRVQSLLTCIFEDEVSFSKHARGRPILRNPAKPERVHSLLSALNTEWCDSPWPSDLIILS